MDDPSIVLVFSLVIIALIMLALWAFFVILVNIGIFLTHFLLLTVFISILSILVILIMLVPAFLFDLYKINRLNSLHKIKEVNLYFDNNKINWSSSHFTEEEYLNKSFATIYAFCCCPLAIGIVIHRLYFTGFCDISINYGTVCKIALIWWAFPGSNSSDIITYIEPIIPLSCSAILTFILLFFLGFGWISKYYEVTQKSVESKIDSLLYPINQILSNNNEIKKINKIKADTEKVSRKLHIPVKNTNILEEIRDYIYIPNHKQELLRGRYEGLNNLIEKLLIQAQEEYKYLSQAEKAYEELILIKKEIEKVGVNLDIALDTNFIETEIFNYIEAHKQELSRGKYDGLNNLIRKILSQTQEEYRHLSKAEKDYAEVLNFYKNEVVKRVNNAESIPLILELEQVYEGLLSENLKDIIKGKKWQEFHDILQSIQADLERLKNLAIKYEREVYEESETSIPYSDIDTEKDEEKAYRILGVPATATDDIIKKAHRVLVSMWHPDAGLVKDDSKIKEINWAYEILKNLRG